MYFIHFCYIYEQKMGISLLSIILPLTGVSRHTIVIPAGSRLHVNLMAGEPAVRTSHGILVPLGRVERPPLAPEANALSIALQGHYLL